MGHDNMSIHRLHRALEAVIIKHSILSTALRFDSSGILRQYSRNVDNHIDHEQELFGFSVINVQDEDEMNREINRILTTSTMFDMDNGRVLNCHIFRHTHLSHTSSHDDVLRPNDVIMFDIHHSVFDGASASIFRRELSSAYENQSPFITNSTQLQYMDYATHEHVMEMSSSRRFWLSQLQGYYHVSVHPLDRHRSSTDQRSAHASVSHITFDDDIAQSFLDYASSCHLTPFQLGLAIFFAFLFKLSHHQIDLCVTCFNANRYRDELQNMIGMFVATLPHRLQLDSRWSFHDLVQCVKQKCLSIFEHTHYPLQHMLTDQCSTQSDASLLGTVFDFITLSSDRNLLTVGGTSLEEIPIPTSYEVAKFDFALTFIYDPSSSHEKLSFRLVCSHDLVDKSTAIIMARRLQYLFEQLLIHRQNENDETQLILPLARLSVVLPQEADEMQHLIISQQNDSMKRGMVSISSRYIVVHQHHSCNQI